MTMDEVFEKHARRIRGIEGASPEEIAELERLVGHPLPKELRAYYLRAGRNPGNLHFVQTHKIVEPSIAESIKFHRPRRHGRHAAPVRNKIFFADGGTCQDCGPAFLALEVPSKLPKLAIDPDDPPVIGMDYDDPVLLAATFTEYVRSAFP